WTCTAQLTQYTGSTIAFYVALTRSPLPIGTEWDFSGSGGVYGLSPYEMDYTGSTFDIPMGGWQNEPSLYPTILIDGAGGPNCCDITWNYTTKYPPPSTYPGQPAAAQPPNASAIAGCPTVSSLQDLGNTLCLMG